MLARTSPTPREMTDRGGRRACLSGGRGNFAVLSAWDIARISSTTSRMRKKTHAWSAYSKSRLVWWCKKMRLLCLLSSSAFHALLLYAREPHRRWRVVPSHHISHCDSIFASATAKVSRPVVIPSESPTWPPTVMKGALFYSEISRLCFLGLHVYELTFAIGQAGPR